MAFDPPKKVPRMTSEFSTGLRWTQMYPRATLDLFGRGFAPAETSERISEVVHGYSHGPSVRGPSGAPRTFLLDGPRRKRARKSPLVSRGGRRARPPCGHSPLQVGLRGDGRSRPRSCLAGHP